MKIRLLLSLLCVVFLSDDVFADNGEVKKGAYPFMGFIYYPDETVVDVTGKRFLRGAVLIQTNWLITSAIQIDSGNGDMGFPRKTLLARLGATTIDKFIFNEDEQEQEREIIQIVRPYNHSATQWWRTDISLLKTLSPFNVTPAVAPATPLSKVEPAGVTCSILVYTNKNWTEDKILIQLPVELLPPSIGNCGSHFFENTMTCASDGEDTKAITHDSANFCQGNNGGPLICEGGVLGLQTYIDNDCKEPHLYQLLSAWDKFITCSTKEICDETQCTNICIIRNKDISTTPGPRLENGTTFLDADTPEWIQEVSTASPANETDDATPTLTMTTPTIKPSTVPVTATLDTNATATITTPMTTELTLPTTPFTTIATTTDAVASDSIQEEMEDIPGPKKITEDEVTRKVKVEAKQAPKDTKWTSGAAERNEYVFQSFSIFILASFI